VPDIRGFKATPLRERIQAVIDSSFARVTYTEAIEILENCKVEFGEKPYWGIDMGSEHERWLAESTYHPRAPVLIFLAYFKRPTVVYNYPKDFKAFYMRRNDDKKTVAAMDILVPGVGELIGGSQREERMDVLLEMLAEKGLEKESYSWYLDLRKYGSVVHSGFGTFWSGKLFSYLL
jgi:asparaginyl-tRNA synthetase